jgi:hypothetical protein
MGFVGYGALDGMDYTAWVAGIRTAGWTRRRWSTSTTPWRAVAEGFERDAVSGSPGVIV